MNRKKELKNKYKRTSQAMGVYQIQNLVNTKLLIGSSMNVDGILNRHRFELKNNSHKNSCLQSDWNEVGRENFEFLVLEELFPRDDENYDYQEDLNCLEGLWLDKLKPYGEKGYNEKKKNRAERLQMIAENRNISYRS